MALDEYLNEEDMLRAALLNVITISKAIGIQAVYGQELLDHPNETLCRNVTRYCMKAKIQGLKCKIID